MTVYSYAYTKTPVAVDRLTYEIAHAAIIVALDHIDLLGNALTVYFKAALSEDEETTLAGLVTAHSGTPLPETPLPVDTATNRPLVTISAFAVNTDYKVKAKGYAGTATAGTTSNVDFAVGAQDRYINGIRMLLKNHAWGDTIDFQVVDKDNVIGYGAGVVLGQFGYSWNVDSEKCDQGREVFNYLARIPAGTYVRIVYTSTGATNVDVKVNLLLHQKVA